jgi:hypothetical protein
MCLRLRIIAVLQRRFGDRSLHDRMIDHFSFGSLVILRKSGSVDLGTLFLGSPVPDFCTVRSSIRATVGSRIYHKGLETRRHLTISFEVVARSPLHGMKLHPTR